MRKYDNNGICRVNKKQARNAYNNGKMIWLLPCNVRFENNRWFQPVPIQIEKINHISNDGFNTIIARNHEFDTVINCFEYYNCNDELGKYTAFYMVKEVTV